MAFGLMNNSLWRTLVCNVQYFFWSFVFYIAPLYSLRQRKLNFIQTFE